MNEHLPVLLLLFFLSVIDIRKRIVPHWGIFALLLYALLVRENYSLSLAYGAYTFLALTSIYFITNGGIGGGDVKLMTALAFYLGNSFPFYLGYLAIFSGAGFLIGFMWHKRFKYSLPLVPFLFVSMLFFI